MVWSGVGAGLSGVVRCGSRVKWAHKPPRIAHHPGRTSGLHAIRILAFGEDVSLLLGGCGEISVYIVRDRTPEC